MKKLLGFLAGVFLLVACTPSQIGGPLFPNPASTAKVVDTHCFDVYVQAYATGESSGAYNCLSDDLQFNEFSNRGIQDDKGLNTFLRMAKDIQGTWDVQQWKRPIPKSVFAGRDPNKQFVPKPGDITRAYFMYPVDEDGSIGYYINGYSLLLTIDSSGKVVDIE